MPLILYPIDKRMYWDGVRDDPRYAGLVAHVAAKAAQAPQTPPRPQATDYLAARRHNDRSPLDQHWNAGRVQFAYLALERCLSGPDGAQDDDRFLNWFWSFLTEPSWTVSAHLPGKDLPVSGEAVLDLASCEMAAQFAEMREIFSPWLQSVSGTLADSVTREIDRRVLAPYGDGKEVGWHKERAGGGSHNWLGVCAGSILLACESLAAQGQPRPQARRRALDGLRWYFETAFTPNGECDEGLGYWTYGMSLACLGLSRLSREELEAHFDLERLRRVADYPRRAHLFGDYFFSGNDAILREPPPLPLLRWLAPATGNSWLARWAERTGDPSEVSDELANLGRKALFSQALRLFQAPEGAKALAAQPGDGAFDPAESRAPQFLEDQQVAILRASTARGELLACLTGGHNTERHNHNDLGHFLVALGGRWIVPDLGAPAYTADFFGPDRYTYLPASSRGHCCPLIGGHEQRAGREAAGTVLSWTPNAATPDLTLDLSAAYGPEAGLRRWTRRLQSHEASDPPGMILRDAFETHAADQPITHVIWSLCAPQEAAASGEAKRLWLGPLVCELSPAPKAWSVTEHKPEALRLREFHGETLYCLHVLYHTDSFARLEIETRFGPRNEQEQP